MAEQAIVRKWRLVFEGDGVQEREKELERVEGALSDLEKRAQKLAKGMASASTKTARSERATLRTIQRNAERRIKLIEDETSRRVQMLELRHERELRRAQGAGEDLQALQELHAQQRAQLDEQITAKATREAERQQKAQVRAAEKAMQVQLADAEARARAIEDQGQRELALLDVKHRRELARAEKHGRDLEAVQKAQARERADAVARIDQQAARRSEEALKKVQAGITASNKKFGQSFDQLNSKLNRTNGRFGDVIARVGDLEDAVRVFSGFVLLDAIRTAGEFIREMYRMTEAGKRAERQQKAQTAAVSKLTTEMDKLAQQGRLTADAIDAVLRREEARALLSEELTALAEKRQKAKRDLVELEKELAEVGQESYDADLRRLPAGARVEDQIRQRRREIVKLNKEFDQLIDRRNRGVDVLKAEAGRLRDATLAQIQYRLAVARSSAAGNKMVSGPRDTLQVLASLGQVGVQVYTSIKKTVDDADKATKRSNKSLREARTELNGITDAQERIWLGIRRRQRAVRNGVNELIDDKQIARLRAGLKRRQQLVQQSFEAMERAADAARRDEDRRLELGVGGASGVAKITAEADQRLVALQRQYQAEQDLARQHGDNMVVLDAVFVQRRNRILADAAQARAEALAAEAAAQLNNVERLGQAAQTLAKKVGASRGVLAAIERVMELARAARETAAAAAAAARFDPISAAAHGVAAAAHVAAAVKFGKVPGAGSGSAGAQAPSAPVPAQPGPSDRPRSAGTQGGTTTNIYLSGIAADRRAVRTAVVDALNEAGDGQPAQMREAS